MNECGTVSGGVVVGVCPSSLSIFPPPACCLPFVREGGQDSRQEAPMASATQHTGTPCDHKAASPRPCVSYIHLSPPLPNPARPDTALTMAVTSISEWEWSVSTNRSPNSKPKASSVWWGGKCGSEDSEPKAQKMWAWARREKKEGDGTHGKREGKDLRWHKRRAKKRVGRQRQPRARVGNARTFGRVPRRAAFQRGHGCRDKGA